MAIALSASDRSFSAQSASGSTPTLGSVAVLDATPTPSPRPEGVLNNGAEAEYGSNDSALSHLGSSSNASQGRRISDARPRVPRLETDAATLSQGRAQQQQQAPLILAHSASTQASSASSSRNGAFFGTPNDVASSSSSSTAAFQPHARQTSGSSTLSAAPAALGHSSSSFSISSMDSVPSESGLARQGSVGRSASTSSRWGATSGFGSSLQTPSSGVELHSASSIRSRRNWDEFEGKPITPLPSPSMYARERNGSLGPFDASFAKEDRGKDEVLLPSEGRAKASSHAVASAAAAAAAAAAEEAPAPGTPSSKTLAFFGAPRSPLPAPSSRSASATFPAPAPRATSNGSSSTDAPAEAASSSSNGGWLSRTNAALNSVSNGSSNGGAQVASPLETTFASAGSLNAARLHQPTRLPTLPSGSASSSGLPPSSSGGHGWLESSFTSSTSQPSPTNTSAFFNTSTSSTSTNGGVGVGIANEERLSSLPSAIMNGGAHRSSPLRPQLGSSTAEAASPSALSTAATTTLVDEVPAARRRGSTTTRHTHGPSENATGSSFLPRESSPSHPATSRPAAATAAAAPTRGTQLGSAPDEEVDEDLDEGRVGVWKIERTLGVGAFSRVVLARRIDAGASSATATASAAGGSGKTNGLRRMLQSTMAHCSPKLSAAAKEEEKTKTAAAAGELEEPRDEVVALKMMEREPCSLNERMRVSWVREVEVLKHISHPNIVRFIDSFSTLRHHTLVLETVSGGELFELLANHQPELAQREWLVRRLFGELAHAVGWMHSINLVHRDIKLENIILTRDIFASPLRPSTLPSVPLVKVTDFGLSRFVDPDAPLLETRCGSEEYAAPELIIGKRYDGRKTDVWALGVVLYALLTGSLPFLEDSSSVGSTAAREGEAGRDARERKAHLLRIAKGDLRWPAASNDDAKDQPAPAECPASNRLITPAAKYLTARLLRRDATKRALAWDVWDDAWMREGSFSTEGESSAEGETFEVPLDPRSERGQAWLAENARVIGGLAEVAAAD